MPQSRLEKKRARREARRKAKRKAIRAQAPVRGLRALLEAAVEWPVLECWVNKDWKDPMQLNQVVVARRNPATGEVVAGVYLVDRACLGVKNAYQVHFTSSTEYRSELLPHFKEVQSMTKVDFNLAAAIVKAGIDYAEQLGFYPHPDYKKAAILLKDANPDAVRQEIPVGGPEGKPFYVSGPYDNAEKIMRKLTEKLGPNGFTFLTSISPDTEMFLEGEEDWEVGADEEAGGLFDDEWPEEDDEDAVLLDAGELQPPPKKPKGLLSFLSRRRSTDAGPPDDEE